MPQFDVTTIGEGQLRYCVPAGTRMDRTNQFDIYVSGTEANVAGLVSRLGWRSGLVTSLPDNPLGRRVYNEFRLAGIDLSRVIWCQDGRLGSYYVEYAVPPRPTQVFYDRKHSCFSRLERGDIDWDYLLDTRLVHLSGLTVPLSDTLREVIEETTWRARRQGVLISFDMNYRSRLWTPQEAAAAVLPIISQVDLLFISRGDAGRLFGCVGTPEEVVQQVGELTRAGHIVTSLSGDGLIGWDRQDYFHQPAREVEIIDRIGAGDAMVGGVLHGWLQGDFPKALRYGVLTAALALSQWGDQLYTSRAEVDQLLDATAADITR